MGTIKKETIIKMLDDEIEKAKDFISRYEAEGNEIDAVFSKGVFVACMNAKRFIENEGACDDENS